MTRKMAQIGGANVVWDAEDDGNAGKHCAVRLWLPGNSAVCYRLPVPQFIWGMSVKKSMERSPDWQYDRYPVCRGSRPQ